jgi:hypothetical protein
LNRKLAVMRAAFDIRQGRLGHCLWPGKVRAGTHRAPLPAGPQQESSHSELRPSLHTAVQPLESAGVSPGYRSSRPRSADARLPADSGRRAPFGIPCGRNTPGRGCLSTAPEFDPNAPAFLGLSVNLTV